MTVARSNACAVRGCVHYRGPIGLDAEDFIFICYAYPKGIPEEILNGDDLHLASRGDDGGFVFEPSGEGLVVEATRKLPLPGLLQDLLKHLPGRHDQQRHAPKSVLAKTSAEEQAWVDSLTPAELGAINGYMNIGPAGIGSAAINGALRGGELSAEERRQVELIDSAISKAPKTKGVTAFYRSLPPDIPVADGAYVSAFKNPPSEPVYGSGGRQLRKFTVPSGTPVAPVSSLHTPFSEEVLLPRDVIVLGEGILKHLPGRHDQQRHDPTKGAGKSAGATVAELMPKVPKSANWERKMAEFDKSELRGAYDNDPQVRELVDDVCGYTQGFFREIREAGNALEEGNAKEWAAREKAARDPEWQEKLSAERERLTWQDTDWQEGMRIYEVTREVERRLAEMPLPDRMYEDAGKQLVHIRGGLHTYETPRGHPEDSVDLTAARAVRAAVGINSAIRNGEAQPAMYRGVFLRHDDRQQFFGKYKVGEEFVIGGPTSFTRSEKIANAFAEGRKAGGATTIKPGGYDRPVIIEIEAGAKGLDVNPLSPFKQEESLTQGRFVIVGNDYEEYMDHTPTLRLRQVDVPEQEVPEWAE